jgi:hypothetical protein
MKNKKEDDRSGLFIPAGLFIGMGFGFLYGELVSFMFIGLGIGFLLMGLYRLITGRKVFNKL